MTLDRRDFLKLTAATAATTALASCTQSQPNQPAAQNRRKPNIIYVFADEHRWCSLPFTETPWLVAPNLTRMAKEGTSFNYCISTSAICTPYRGMLLTGLWPHRSGFISNDLIQPNSIQQTGNTIADPFKAAGYVTGYVGKWHLEEDSVYNSRFDYFKHWLYGDNHQESKWRDVPSKQPYQTYNGYNAVGMTDQALDFIKQNASGDKPMFLMLSLNPPHFQWNDAPEEDLKLYPEDKVTFRPNVTKEHWKTGDQLLWYRNYHAHITAVDREVGRVLDALKQHGIDDNTIVLYSADHGSSWGSNDVANKSNPFDEAIRVPFLVRWPSHVPTNRTVDNLLGSIDIYPTLCRLAGINPPQFCDGQDFSPVILGKHGADPASAFIAVNNFQRNYFRTQLDPDLPNILHPFRGVRTKRYTYTAGVDGDWQLFDNQQDPYQMNNLVNDPGHAKIKTDLHKELTRWLAKAEDPFISAEWKALPLPKRIAIENRHYSLQPFKKQWDKLKADALAPYLANATPDQQKQLHAAAGRIYDEPFFGYYKAHHLELNTQKRNSKRPLPQIRAELSTHEHKAAESLKTEATKILANNL
jgi:arylsulfatase A-like enzyme